MNKNEKLISVLPGYIKVLQQEAKCLKENAKKDTPEEGLKKYSELIKHMEVAMLIQAEYSKEPKCPKPKKHSKGLLMLK